MRNHTTQRRVKGSRYWLEIKGYPLMTKSEAIAYAKQDAVSKETRSKFKRGTKLYYRVVKCLHVPVWRSR